MIAKLIAWLEVRTKRMEVAIAAVKKHKAENE
jgi:hypothetical protein